MMTQLRAILVERRKAAYWRGKWWDRVRPKYGLPSAMGLSVDHGSGEVRELGDASHLLCTLDAGDLAAVVAIPTDEDFDRYERHILTGDGGHAVPVHTGAPADLPVGPVAACIGEDDHGTLG